jgi:2-amino-4-hydroxy-6-hydroxymethyldihydropteridine diphosphokinase
MTHTAWIGFGSNLGDKIANCRFGLTCLMETGIGSALVVSPLYRTAPMHVPDQDWFVNGVARMETDFGPETLLDALQQIQKRAGRKEGGIRFGPRILDLDLLFYDKCILQSERLAIPHPRLHERRFVLQPACDIDPCWVHPVLGSDLQTLLSVVQQQESMVQVIDDPNSDSFFAGISGLSFAQGGHCRQYSHPCRIEAAGK